MPGLIFSRVEGREGEIRIPALGALIGQFQKWSLVRRGQDSPGEGLYDLRAELSYVNPHLWNDPDYTKVIRITFSRGKQYRLEQTLEGARVALEGRSLLVEGVKLWPVE
jgi:hypothetical protein